MRILNAAALMNGHIKNKNGGKYNLSDCGMVGWCIMRRDGLSIPRTADNFPGIWMQESFTWNGVEKQVNVQGTMLL